MALFQDNDLDPSGNCEEKGDKMNQFLYHCDMCCSKVTDSSSPNFDIPQGFCTESPQSLRHQLFAYFILTKLLKVSKGKYFEAASAPDPSTFSTRFCGNCQEIINEALKTHRQLIDLQRKIDELGEALSKIIFKERRGTSGGSGKRKMAKSYFQAIFDKAHLYTDGNHGNKVIQVMKIENSANVKQEEQEEVLLEREDYVDNFNDYCLSSMSSDGEDVNQSSTRESDNEWQPDNVVDSEPEPDQPDYHKDNFDVSISSPNRKLESGSEPKYQCKICNSAFQRPLNLRRHMKAHEESTQFHGNKYDCPQCKYPAVDKCKLRYHLAKIHKMKLDKSYDDNDNKESHRNDLDEDFVDDNDGNGKPNITTEMTYDNEDDIELEKDSNFPCKLCETVYQRRLGYRRHMEAHKQSSQLYGNKYDCPQCKYPCLSENKLRFHLAKIHKIKDENPKTSIKNKLKKRKNYGHGSDDSEDSEEEQEEREKKINNSKYSCNICGTVYQRRLGYRRHLQAHKLSTQLHKNKYDCPECKYPALSEFKLKFHLSQKHNSMENNTCSICGFKGERRYLYEKHMLKKHDVRVWTPMTDPSKGDAGVGSDGADMDPTYPCDKCTMIYKSDRGIREHKKDHQWSEENDHKFDCDECGYPARSERGLKTHKTKFHPSPVNRSLQCTVCDFTATTTCKMSSHMFHKHSGVKRSYDKVRIRNRSKWLRNLKNGKFVCELCQVGYTHSETLKKHMKFHEKTKRELGGRWDCKKCGYPTMSEEILNKHMTSAHNKEHLRCERCQKRFNTANIFKMHMRIHKRSDRYLNSTTGVFECKFCDFQSKSMNGILLHKKTHAEENQPVPISSRQSGEEFDEDGVVEEVHLCPHCGNSFNSAGRLQAHVRQKHEGIYRFYCEFCSKGYGCIRNLNEHLLTHDKNRVVAREHVCDVCGADYLHQRSLAAHIAKFHGRDGLKARMTTNKMYRCRWCNKEFQYKLMLAKHLPADHADLYKFRCEFCTKSYISGSSLRLHKEMTHKISSSELKVGVDGEGGSSRSRCEYCGKLFSHRHNVICHYRFCAAWRQSKYSSTMDADVQSTSQQILKTE